MAVAIFRLNHHFQTISSISLRKIVLYKNVGKYSNSKAKIIGISLLNDKQFMAKYNTSYVEF